MALRTMAGPPVEPQLHHAQLKIPQPFKRVSELGAKEIARKELKNEKFQNSSCSGAGFRPSSRPERSEIYKLIWYVT